MARILVHITQGPENPTRAALGFLVARTAVQKGHDVRLFLAGDAVQLIRPAVVDSLVGLGTGQLREHFDVLRQAGCEIYLSGMSCQARGVDEPGDFRKAMPDVLLELALESDTVFTY